MLLYSVDNENKKLLDNLYKEKGEIITDIQLFRIRLNKINEEIIKLLGVIKSHDKD